MSTLAYYSNLIKKEEILLKLSKDAEEISSIANDIVCDIKVISVSCKNRDIETSLHSVSNAEESMKVLNAMLENLKNNLYSYVSTLNPQQDKTVEKQTENKPDIKEDPAGKLSSLMEAIKSLKEMQQSIETK